MNLKKPEFWNLEKPNIFAYLLLPIAFLIQLINFFKIKLKKEQLKIKTICVGNIYIGGTGKTSLSIKINEILKKKNIKSCFVRKFYKNQIDEQKLLQSHGKLFLSQKRLHAINQAASDNYEVAILDDGLQDFSLDCDLEIVCFNSHNWIGNGLTIPAGPLRESLNNLKKYQNIAINGNEENLDVIKKNILEINPEINIYVGKYVPMNLNEFDKKSKYLAFSGIGNHQTFISMLQDYGLNICKNLEFPDHYIYKNKDINKILNISDEMDYKIITTEKDFLRLNNEKIDKIKYIKSDLQITDEEKLIGSILKNR
ncbi:tetraacyldisaccharide 4'-kinase [Candidatus Pelagibacter sp.]|nr:tetraacyldisaccharide 4'-kinase [Candidatus Pelagibacter sp.]